MKEITSKTSTLRIYFNDIMVLKQLSMQAINPVLRRNNYDHLQVKIGIDVSEHSIIKYVLGEKSYIDILGYGISMTTKMTKLATNSITIHLMNR